MYVFVYVFMYVFRWLIYIPSEMESL
jgi:hypothetical protein